MSCVPGHKKCSGGPGKWYEQCKPDGCGYTNIAGCVCGCNNATGCNKGTCKPNAYYCDPNGTTLHRCHRFGCGSFWKTQCKCGCAAGACKACP